MPCSMGVGCSLEALSLKLGYQPRLIESGGSTPPLVGIPHDLLALALDTPNRISRFCLRAMPRFDLPLGALTRVLEGNCRTPLVGQSALPQGFIDDLHQTYLVVEGNIVAVCLVARWALLFRREPLRRCFDGWNH